MIYCNDLTFVNYGYAKNAANNTAGRRFEGYYGIQFLSRGRMYAHTGTRPAEFAEGPCVFISFPGVPFHYGSPEGTVRSQLHLCFRGERVARYCAEGLITLREMQLFRRLRNPEKVLHITGPVSAPFFRIIGRHIIHIVKDNNRYSTIFRKVI